MTNKDGEQISRQRLYRENLEYLRTRKPAVWTEEEYTRLKSIYPLYFETTERIGSVHASTFQSPTVSILCRSHRCHWTNSSFIALARPQSQRSMPTT